MEIDKFDEFLKGLFESYDSPVEIKWVDKIDKLFGFFKINDKVYQINCINKVNDIWTYKFYLYDVDKNEFNPNLTNFNTGKLSILSTIRNGMDYLINLKSPKALVFGAVDESEGRKKLYWSYSKEIENEYKYTLVTRAQDNKQIFILHKDIDKEILMSTVESIIEDNLI